MGGAFPGAYPPPMRVAAVVQALILAGVATTVLSRAGVGLRRWRPRRLCWAIVALLGVGLVLNLITPSALERAIWAPVVAVMLLCALRVAYARDPA